MPCHATGKKKTQDPFARKDWYDIKAPTSFNVRNVGKTLVTRTTGTKVRASGMRAARWGGSVRPCLHGGSTIPPCPLRLQIASEALKGRVFEVSLADLQKVGPSRSHARLAWPTHACSRAQPSPPPAPTTRRTRRTRTARSASGWRTCRAATA